jgi:hypothetical protein
MLGIIGGVTGRGALTVGGKRTSVNSRSVAMKGVMIKMVHE